ncbi:MAG TPA: hypothetical protein VN380_20485 [Thermoanaerobaculia bacterium]|jgi:hypothetical protein|nr:hypothetical protein [Thermoanaerobaculia bacterium]
MKSPTRATVMSLVPTLTVWAIGRILEMPGVKGKVMEIDGRANKQKYDLERSLKRGIRNAKSHIPLVAAGVAAIVVGVGLMAISARER